MTPLITVVIPAYNRGKELRRALDSLAQQTCNNFEVIVCDDGSSDDLKPVVSEFEQSLIIHYFRIENSGGPARPRNIGIMNARTEWISFLDSDDWWHPERIANITSHLTAEVDLVYHPLIVAKDGDKVSDKTYVGHEIVGDALSYMVCYGNPIPNSSAIVRKSFLQRIGGISEDRSIISLEDFDAWLSLAETGCRIQFVDQPLGYYWVGNDNISAFSHKQVSGQLALFAKHLPRLSPELRKLAESCHYYLIGSYFIKLGNHVESKKFLERANHLPTVNLKIKRYAKLIAVSLKCFFHKT